MNILGISAWYHDAAACLVRDGEIVAAAQEERFTRKKHDPEFPHEAIRSCLEIGGIKPEEVDVVGFYDKPFLKFERLLETYVACAPKGLRSFHAAMPHPRMSSEEWTRAYQDAWRIFYSFDNMRSILSRTKDRNYFNVMKNFIWYRNAMIEGEHPMITGFFRRKRRKQHEE